MEEKESIFRKSAMNRISSPEELDRYLTVTGPQIWLTLAAIIVLLIGLFAWMILGKLDTVETVAVVAEQGKAVCLVPAEQRDAFLKCGTVKVGDKEYTLSDVGFAPELITSETDLNVRIAGSLAEGVLVAPLKVEASLEDGTYQGEVVIESVKPISFIIN